MGDDFELPLTLGLCVRRGIWKTFSPELKPIKDTEVENIFYCSDLFVKLGSQLISERDDQYIFFSQHGKALMLYKKAFREE